jgi:hypothetical protein
MAVHRPWSIESESPLSAVSRSPIKDFQRLLWSKVNTTILQLRRATRTIPFDNSIFPNKEDNQMADSMYSIFVAINVKPEHRSSFMEASTVEAQEAVKSEPGLF